jgi:O-antigen/teichoic acid export membrane protein
LFFGFIIGLGIISSAFFIHHGENPTVFRQGLWIIGAIVPLILFYQFTSTLLRTENRFNPLSIATILFSVFAFVLAVVLGKFYAALGLVASLFASYLLVDIYLLWTGRFHFAISLDLPTVKIIFQIGMPMMAIQLLYQILVTVDSLIITNLYPSIIFGYYSIAILISRSMQEIPSVINSIISPRASELYGNTRNPKDLEPLFKKPLLLVSLLLPFLIGTLFFMADIFILHIIPKYQPAWIPTQILLLSGFFLTCALLCFQLFFTLGKYYQVLAIYIAIILLEFTGCMAAYHMNYALPGIACAMLGSHFIFALVMIISSFGYFHYSLVHRVWLFIKLLVPLLFTGVLCQLCSNYLPLGNRLTTDIGITLVRWFILFVLSLPFFWYVNQKTHLFTSLKEIVSSRLNAGNP